NLRGALWQARQSMGECVRARGSYVSLAPEVEVDLVEVVGQAKRLIGPSPELREGDTEAEPLRGDLLPAWDEDWILFERERLRQLRVHALEALCRRLSAVGRHGEAVDAGQAAVAAEPLRESAQRTLIAAHLAEGNLSEAQRQYDLYRKVLWEDMALEPSGRLRSMLAGDGRPRDRGPDANGTGLTWSPVPSGPGFEPQTGRLAP
ncbi:MAG TPA: bacterial transcriptional activator domain-containing protein, partial [Acidimicrobiales bacterium]|nr:bacterial transcriptional activator domain-containing protein [Acidimicrobiales bacterium]